MDNLKSKALLEQEILADLSPEGQHEKRLARYSVAMGRKESVLDYILNNKCIPGKNNLISEARELEKCGSFLIFRHYYSVDQYKMIAGCTCKKHLLCALCAIRRAARYIAIYSKKLESILDGSMEEFEEVMLTFTIKNGDDLGERFNHLLDSMKDLLQKRRNALKKNPRTDTIFKAVEAALYSYEVTFKDETGFHPHCHMVALIPKGIFEFTKTTIKGKSCFVPWKLKNELTEEWKQITGDSFILDARRIERHSLDPVTGEIGNHDRLRALVEVFKYALKMNDMDVSVQVSSYEALKGRRLIGSFGSLRGVQVPKDLNDMPLDDSELPYIDLMYQYSGVTYGYQETFRGQFDLAPRSKQTEENFSDFFRRIKKNQKLVSEKPKEKIDYSESVNEFFEKKLTQYDDCMELIEEYYGSLSPDPFDNGV